MDDPMTKKAWWHSDIVRLSGAGGLMVRLKGDPQASKFPGKPAFCYFECADGAGVVGEHTLNVENDLVATSLRVAPKNQWVRVTAGGKAEQAWLNAVVGEAPPAPTAPAISDGPPPTEWPPETKAPPTAPPASLSDSGTVGAAIAMTIQAVRGLEKSGIRVDSDAAARIYNTHFIQASR